MRKMSPLTTVLKIHREGNVIKYTMWSYSDDICKSYQHTGTSYISNFLIQLVNKVQVT